MSSGIHHVTFADNMRGFMALTKREIVRFIVVIQQTLFPPIVNSTLFIFIFGLSVGKRVDLPTYDGSYLSFMIPGILTMHLISSAFENNSSSLFISRWHNHIQEILLSPLSYFEMVLSLLIGGVVRAVLVAIGVFAVACCFEPIPISHPFALIYFGLMISVIFSCAGMIAALWANNFSMLSIWNVYVIMPLVFLGGVFNPIDMLPEAVQTLAHFNPMFYFVNGMRYGLLGISEVPLWICAAMAGGLAIFSFAVTVHLFRIGYKLRN